jgi:adenylate kinase
MSNRISTILLVGPGGSGKTPLGEYLQLHGLGKRRCAHFDFGAQLRLIASGGHGVDGLTDAELLVIRTSLESGALLEDKHFPIAARILRAFAAKQKLGSADLIILNGLPRHEGQAHHMDGVVAMEAVISLQCSARVVHERIHLNSGGDRAGRADDSVEAIARKLDLFGRRTLPLIEFYRRRGVGVYSIIVAADTSPQQICQQLAGAMPSATAPPSTGGPIEA